MTGIHEILGAGDSGNRPSDRTIQWSWVLGLCLLALAVRLFFLAATDWIVDSDEAIVGLMAKHILETGAVPVFYYGQHYMGSLEPLLVALGSVFWGAGTQALKLVPLLFSILLVFLTYVLALRASGHRAARVAGLLMALPPVTMVEWSTKARGGFVEVIVLGVVSLLLCIRWCQTKANFDLFMTALVLGLGWWVNNQIIFYILPIAFVVSLHSISWRFLPRLALGVLAFSVGGLPYWYYNVMHGFASLSMLGGSADILANIEGLFSSALPIILGARRFWHVEDLVPGLSYLVYALYLYIFAQVLRSRALASETIQLCVLTVLASLSVFSLSAFGSLSTAPRYLLPLYPVLFVLAGAVLGQPGRLPSVLVSVLLISNLLSNYWGGVYVPGTPFAGEGERVARDHRELIEWLEHKDYSFVRTNYWIGYRLAFETKEMVRPILFGKPWQIRIPEYESQGSHISEARVPYVLTPELGNRIAHFFENMGYSFKRASLSGYAVLYDVGAPVTVPRPIPSSEFSVKASHNSDQALFAVDGQVNTRWGSAAPQNPAMLFEIIFRNSETVQEFDYSIGSWESDWGRALQVKCIGEHDRGHVLVSREDYLTHREFFPAKVLRFRFPSQKCDKIAIEQVGEDTFFDWSIAELQIYS